MSCKTVNTKFGTTQVKEDVELLDQSGAIPLHVWGATMKELQSGACYNISNMTLKSFRDKPYLSTTFSTVVTPVTLAYEMPKDVMLGETYVITNFTSVVSVKILRRCKNCNFALDLAAETNGKIRCTNVQANCTRAYRVTSLPKIHEVTVSFDGVDKEEKVVVLSNIAFKKLMERSKMDSEENESGIEDVFLDWNCEIRLVVEGELVKDVFFNGGG